ncbi:hypothetical protein [Ruminococcus sp.]
MKKKYVSPELEVVSLLTKDVLTASEYTAHPEDPTRAGNEGLDDL